MKINKIIPPREFIVGFEKKITLRDCAHIGLNPNEQITLVGKEGSEFDIARKVWGYYATPSLNKRLKSFGLRAVLVRSSLNNTFFILLVEKGKETVFKKYLSNNGMNIVVWLDSDKKLKALGHQKNGFVCEFCNSNFSQIIFSYKIPPNGETDFLIPPRKYRRKIIQCKSCLHLYNNHKLDLDNLYSNNYVDSTYGSQEGLLKTYDRIMKFPKEKSDNYGRVKHVIGFMKAQLKSVKKSPSVLDIGSGLCVFLKLMKKAGWNCTALDPDRRAINHAIKTVGVKGVCADVFKAKKIGTFDLITFNKVLEHTPRPVEMLKTCMPFLKKGGFVYIEVPDGECAMIDGPEREEFFIEHYHIFSMASLNILAVKSGLKIVKMERVKEPSTKYTLRAFLTNI